MDLSSTIIAKSDQQNADDYVAGPRTVTISEVRKGSVEQPVEIHLEEFPGRPYKPSKGMRRVLVTAWGKESDVYAGRQMTLYRDPTVKWAGEPIGGIRISHLSHIDKPVPVALAIAKGKRQVFTVKPLPKQQAAPKNDGWGEDTTPMISEEQWAAVKEHLEQDKGITGQAGIGAWVQDFLGREVGSPQQITRDEAERMLADFSKEAVS